MKLKEIAEKIAAAEPFRSVDAVHSILRNPGVKALLDGQSGWSRTSAGVYGATEVMRARIFVALHDAGQMTATMQVIDEALRSSDHLAPGSVPVGRTFESPLDEIIRGTVAGESWTIWLRFVAKHDGTRRVQPVFCKGETYPVESERADRTLGQSVLGTLVLPVSRFIKPLLNKG